ncbi:MAG: extracellular solute-binding protein [Candidatus Bathyarchaeia archaeon]
MGKEEKVSRRGYVKYAAAGVVVVAVAAGGAYYATRPKPPSPVTLNFYTTGHSGFYYDVGYTGWKPIENYMKQNPHIKINVLVDSFFDVYTKEASTFAAGTYAWDVAYTWGGITQEFHKYWTPLSEMGVTLPSDVQDDIVPYAKNAIWHKGEWYGLPRMFEIFTLNGDGDVLDAKGLSFPTSFEEMLEVFKEVHEPERGRVAMMYGLKQGYLFPPYLCYLHGNGGAMWKDDAMQTWWADSDASIKAAKDMLTVFENYMSPASLTDIAFVESCTKWYNGESVFGLYYPWIASVMLDPTAKIKNVYSWLWPGHKGVVRSGSQVACEGYAIPKMAKYKKEAWDFIQYLNSREVQVQMALSVFWKQENEEPIPTRWSYIVDDRLKKMPYALIMRSSLAQSKYKANRYERPMYGAFITATEAAVASVLAKEKNAEDAMKAAQEECDKFLQEEYAKFGGGYYDPWPDMQKYKSRIDDLIKQIPVEERFIFPE